MKGLMKTATNREIYERYQKLSERALERANAALSVAIATPIGIFVGFVASIIISM